MKRILSIVLVSLVVVSSLIQTALADDGFIDGTKTLVPYGLNAKRIICLAPNCTEMLWFLGLGDRQVARTDFCNYPPAVLKLPSIGGFADTSLEAIVAAKPDLVVAYQGNSLKLVAQLRELHITVLAFAEASGLGDIGAQMRELCGVAGPPGADVPQQLADWKMHLDGISNIKPAKRLKVFYGYPGEMTYSCGKGSFLDDLISRAGGINVVSIDDHWPAVSSEYIVAAAPEVLLTATACTGPKCDLTSEHQRIDADLSSQPPWNSLPAVKDKRLIVVDADVILRPGPRILDALEQVETALAGWSK